MSTVPSPSSRSAAPVAVRHQDLAEVRYDANGLVPAVVQEAATGQVLMVAWMNEATLRQTLESGRMTYWSRSRGEVWVKGETSGERQWLRQAYYDCDGDTLLFVVDQEGQGACHTGHHTCFYRSFGG
jgi:phosphoribosyl-AMP cyclohydrolase